MLEADPARCLEIAVEPAAHGGPLSEELSQVAPLRVQEPQDERCSVSRASLRLDVDAASTGQPEIQLLLARLHVREEDRCVAVCQRGDLEQLPSGDFQTEATSPVRLVLSAAPLGLCIHASPGHRATERIDDPTVLARVAREDADEAIRREAAELLIGIAQDSTNADEAQVALDSLAESRALALVARHAELVSVALAGDKHPCKAGTQECLDKMIAKIQAKGWLGVETEQLENGRWQITKVYDDSPAQAAGFCQRGNHRRFGRRS